MTRILLLALTICCVTLTHAQEWEFIAEDSDQSSINFILESGSGFYGLDNYGNQYSVVKYDANKQALWSTQVTCLDDLWIRSFLEGPGGNLYVIGEFYQTCSFQTDTITGNFDFIAVYDANGNEIDLHLMPVSHKIRGAAFNDAGNLMLATSFGSFGSNNYTLINGDTIYTHGAIDIMFMEMSTSFSVLDTSRIWSTTADYVYSMIPRDGGYDVITNFLEDLNYPGGTVSHEDYDYVLWRVGQDMSISEQYVIEYRSSGSSFGQSVVTGNGEMFFFLRLSSWASCYLSSDSLAGDGEYKNYLVKMADDGTYEWSKQLAGHPNKYATFAQLQMTNDSLYFGGYSNYNLDFDAGSHYSQQYKYNMFIGVADESGNTQLLSTIDDTTINGQSYVYGSSIQNGSLYFCGAFNDTVKINGESFDGSGYRGFFGRFDVGAEVITNSEELNSKFPMVYPNPASDIVHIQSPVSLQRIQLHDQSGRMIKEITTNSLLYSMSVNDLSSGVYFLTIHNEGGQISRRKIILD